MTKLKSCRYIIISKPNYIAFICPHCGKTAKINFENVIYKTDFWEDGAYVDCSECGKNVELGDYEYY